MAETVAVYDLAKNYLGEARVEHDERGMYLDTHPVKKPYSVNGGWVTLDVRWTNRKTGTQHYPVLIKQ
jgi:hypothetical protein